MSSEDELARLREAFERHHADTVEEIAGAAEELAAERAKVTRLRERVRALEAEVAELRAAAEARGGLLGRLRRDR